MVNTHTGTTSSLQAGWSPESCYRACLNMGSGFQGKEKPCCMGAEGTGMDFQHTEEVACISSAHQF